MSVIDFPPEDKSEPTEPSEQIVTTENTIEARTYTPSEIDISFLDTEFTSDSLPGLMRTHASTRDELCLRLQDFSDEQTIKHQQEVALKAKAVVNTLTDEMQCLLNELFDQNNNSSVGVLSQLYYNDWQIVQNMAHEVSGAISKNPGISYESLNLSMQNAFQAHAEESPGFVKQCFSDDYCGAYKLQLSGLVDSVLQSVGYESDDARDSESLPVGRLKKIGQEFIRAAVSTITIAAGVAIGSIIANKLNK